MNWQPADDPCPLCKGEVQTIRDHYNRRRHIKCKRCGVYEAGDMFLMEMRNAPPRPLLSGLARGAHERGETLRITADNMDELEKEAPRNSSGKSLALLKALARKSSTPGGFAQLGPDDYPLAFAINFGELCVYMKGLNIRGMFDNYIHTTAGFSVILSMSAWQEIEEEDRPAPEALESPMSIAGPPAEIQASLARFKVDHPDERKVAFIMMRFGRTDAHAEIVEGIRKALEPHGIVGVRADDKQYHDDLFPNILTYIYGCGFGVAVFERIEDEVFNPNVALEVGYSFALGKPVCLLKDQTLKTLHTDLVGKLYRTFDSHSPVKSIPPELTKWLSDKGIA